MTFHSLFLSSSLFMYSGWKKLSIGGFQHRENETKRTEMSDVDARTKQVSLLPPQKKHEKLTKLSDKHQLQKEFHLRLDSGEMQQRINKFPELSSRRTFCGSLASIFHLLIMFPDEISSCTRFHFCLEARRIRFSRFLFRIGRVNRTQRARKMCFASHVRQLASLTLSAIHAIFIEYLLRFGLNE